MFSASRPALSSTVRGAAATGTSYSGSSLSQLIHMHSGVRQLYWRFDLLTTNQSDTSTTLGAGTYYGYKDRGLSGGDLTPYVTKATISYDVTRPVKRSLELNMVETVSSQTVTTAGGQILSAGVDYLHDLVQPVALIKAPAGWLHFPLGVFRFTQPGVVVPGYAVVRNATMPDLLSLVQEDAVTDATLNPDGKPSGTPIPLTLPPEAAVIDVITALLTNPPTNIPTNPATLANLPGCGLGALVPLGSADWPTSAQIAATIPGTAAGIGAYTVDEGTNLLDLINHLLYTIGCYDLMADENGIFRIQQWPPNQDYRQQNNKDGYNLTVSPFSQWTYDTTHDSIVAFGLTEDIMIDQVPNVLEVIVEDGFRASFYAVAKNEDPNSPYSIQNRKRNIVKTKRDPMVPDADANGVSYVQKYAKQELLVESWLTDEVQVPIAVNPMHAGGTDRDVVTLNILQTSVAAGSLQNQPVITGNYAVAVGGDPGLRTGQTFVVDGWTITATLSTPGGGSTLTGNVGLTSVLEPRETKQGHTMTLTCHRLSGIAPSLITFA